MQSPVGRLGAALVLILAIGSSVAIDCKNAKRLNNKLFCYYGKSTSIDGCYCTHVILPADADVKIIDGLRGRMNSDVKILVTVNEFNQGLINTIKSSKIDGLEIDLKKLSSKNDISDFISTVRTKIGTDLYLALSVPPKAELLAKYYDMKALTKHTDVFLLQTAFLGASTNVTFHPSRLSGLWDMQNTDSVVDLVSGLGAPLSKLVLTAPVQGFQFTLQELKHTTIGSPAVELKSVTRDELCTKMGSSGKNWTLERDQDQAGPYIFREKEWIAFEDPTSIDIKAKYARVRGLAGMALKDLSQDGGAKCGGTLLEAAYTGLSRQARAPRGAVLQSLEREILEPAHRPLDTIQISPYRISRVVDVDGNVHDIRQDTRTEFECSRQGYFVHPRSCGRFYRCVKFDQLSDEFSVFEFDCPAGLAFDSRYEVCVWPGSLPHASACSGSSEIAPVPRERFVCPGRAGYYADPENCRWFFACMDHGKSPLTAYEFRCPFGLVFDESRLLCEWPWLVPTCHNGGALGFESGSVDFYGGLSAGAATLETYNGLGALGTVALGGLSGTIVETPAKVYTSVGSSLAESSLVNTHQESNLNLAGELDQRTLFGQDKLDIRYDGADSSEYQQNLKSSVEYHGNNGQSNEYNTISLGNVASVQRGYSAVATGLDVGLDVNRANVQINHAGSYAAIPTATAVPVPVIKSEAHYGTAYAGQVVANVPELQYKIPASYAYANLSNTYSNFLSSGGYGYKKPVQAFAGYAYQRPAISLETYQKPVIQQTVVQQPAVALVQQTYQKQAADSFSYHNQEHSGYHYEKPSVSFVETASPAPIAVSVSPQVQQVGVGYEYPKPSVSYVEQPAVSIQHSYVSSTPKPIIQDIKVGYEYQKPAVTFVQQPAVSVQPAYSVSSTISPPVQKVSVGYSYPKPTVSFVEQPAPAVSVQQTFVSSTPKPVDIGYSYPQPTVSYVQQPTFDIQKTFVVSSPRPFQKVNVGYEYPKPTVSFVEKPAVSIQHTYVQPSSQPVVQQVFTGYKYEKPAIAVQKVVAPTIQTYVQPAIQTVQKPAPIVTSYQYQQPVVEQTIVAKKAYVTGQQATNVFSGYEYQKPQIKFEERPAVSVSQINYQQTNAYLPPKQEVYVSSTPKYEYVQPQQPKFYVTPTPKYEQVSVAVNPFQQYVKKQESNAYVSFKSDYGVKTVTQAPVYQETYVTQSPAIAKYSFSSYDDRYSVSSGPKVSVQPASYETNYYVSSTPKSVEYVAPKVNYEQNFYVSSTPKVAPVSYEQKYYVAPTQKVYAPPPKVAVAPVNYEQNFYVASTPKPTYVPQKVAAVPVSYEQNYYVSSTPKSTYIPQKVAAVPVTYEQNYYVSSTPKPTYVPQKVAAVPVSYEQNYYVSSTPKTTYVQPAKVAVAPVNYEQNFYVSSTPKPQVKVTPISYETDYYVQSTPKPTFQSIVTPVKVKQQEQAFYSYDSRVGSTPKPYVSVSTTAAPVVIKQYQEEQYQQSPAISKYEFGTLVDKAVNYDYNYDYVSSTAKTVVQQQTEKYESYPVEEQYVVSTPKTKYVPVTTSKPIYVPVSTPAPTYAPVKVVKVVQKKKPKTIVRVNDFHPFLTTKLGAQCTCSSNTVKLRKPTAQSQAPIDDYSDEKYIQVTEKTYKPLSEEYIRVEDNYGDYDYEPQKIVEVTQEPRYVVKSTTAAPQEVYAVKKRVKVVQPVTQATIAFSEAPVVKVVKVTKMPEIFFVKKKSRPTTVTVVEDDYTEDQNERELTAAVRKGLKALKSTIKQSAKEGAREGTEEALDGKRFDRYGPGGWRGRDETLQGTVDCQRAGLFRHPSHCNKFYACRWDCTKKRFTLHVFNCPVHLTFDNGLGACNWPSQGPACVDNTLLPSD